MKRKDTSKLLNEWKSFLNESQLDTEFIDRLPDEDRNALSADVAQSQRIANDNNQSLESIAASLTDMGLEQEDIDDTIARIEMLSQKSIGELDDEFSDDAYSNNLEEDPHLSER